MSIVLSIGSDSCVNTFVEIPSRVVALLLLAFLKSYLLSQEFSVHMYNDSSISSTVAAVDEPPALVFHLGLLCSTPPTYSLPIHGRELVPSAQVQGET